METKPKTNEEIIVGVYSGAGAAFVNTIKDSKLIKALNEARANEFAQICDNVSYDKIPKRLLDALEIVHDEDIKRSTLAEVSLPCFSMDSSTAALRSSNCSNCCSRSRMAVMATSSRAPVASFL